MRSCLPLLLSLVLGRAAEPGRYQLRLRTGGASMADPDDYFAIAR